MTSDPVVERVGEIRHAISEEHGHDVSRLIEYYRKRMQTRGRRIREAGVAVASESEQEG